YGTNCQSIYTVRCKLDNLTPTDECYDKNGEKVTGLKYLDKANNCPLYNYTDIIHLKYLLHCEQVPSAQFNLSLTANNYTFFSKIQYFLNSPPMYISRDYGPIHFNTRIWNFNRLGTSNDIDQILDNEHLIGNKTIEVEVDLGKYYLPEDKMESIFNGGRVLIEAGFALNYKLLGTGVPRSIVSYINIGNYFKNTDFFEKEVILKTIKQILSIVIPAVVGSVILFVIFVVIIYVLYRKTRPMKISC
ncbi:hypothetical protein PIROE2DRAFT_14632, partial [Piromyces sp. E2]